MRILNKLKRAFAIVATFALLATTAAPALAQTFNDVGTSHWAFDFIEQLVDEGVFDVSDNFSPDRALNRAELVKIVITAIDGLAGYEAPATPTFDDVAPDAWFYDYVEAAVQLDIVNGYTDASGNLTGLFGPGDTVNRAAATKILVNAFSVPTTLTPGSKFPDVKTGDWFHDYVVTAYNQTILDGYANGKFGPADAVTRAQVAKLVVNSQDPVLRTVSTPVTDDTDTDDTDTDDTTPAVVSEGDLEVSLNDRTPSSSTAPLQASNVALVSWDLTAASDDVRVTQLVVTRGGVGEEADWSALYLYEGAKRLTTGRTINNDTNIATFPIKNFTVSAGKTRTLTLVGDVAASGTATASNQHYFYVASAADVKSNAQSVAGDFPVAGNIFTIGSVSANTVDAQTGTSISEPLIGSNNAIISSFKLVAGSTNDIALHRMVLTQNGTLSPSKLSNLRLMRSNDELATVESFDGELVTFVLNTPYVIPKGQTRTFEVRADIDGGRTSDTLQLYLDENTDLTVIDMQYGFGALVRNNGTNPGSNALKPKTTAGSFDSGVVATALKGGKITVTDNGPEARQIAQNANNVEILNYSITADRELTVRDMGLIMKLSRSGTDATQPNVSALGTGTGLLTATAATGTYTLADAAVLETETYTATINGTAVVYTATAGDAAGTDAVDTLAIMTGLAAAIDADATVGPIVNAVVTDAAGTTTITLTAVTGGTVGHYTTVAADTSAGGTLVATAAALAGGVNTGTTTNVCVTTAAGATGTDQILQDDMISIPTADGLVYAIVTNVPASSTCGAASAGTLYTTNNTAATAQTAGTITEINPYTLVENVRVVDLDTGVTVSGPLTRASDGTIIAGATDHEYSHVFSEDYELHAGETRHFSVQVDMNQNLADGFQFATTINYAVDGYIKDFNANENVALGDIVGGNITGKFHTVTANSLTVTLASNPSSDTFVKGSNVNSLGISLRAGDAGAVTVKKFYVRVYGDDDATWDAGTGNTGDTQANTLVTSIALYEGNDLVAESVTPTLIDANGTGFTAGTDYYRAAFDNMNYSVPAGTTKTVTARVKLQNTPSATRYLTLDVVPSADITAEDVDFNSLSLSETGLNSTTTKSPLITIATSGTLTIFSESNPPEGLLITGAQQQHAARYRFHSVDEPFNVEKLTVILDETGDFGTAVSTASNDFDPITVASNGVILTYKDINGVDKVVSGSLSAGSATISTPGFYVDSANNGDTYLNIYANTAKAPVYTLSGKKLRLGLRDTTNTITTFKVVGASSSTTVSATDTTGPSGNALVLISGGTNVKPFTLRRSMPVVTIEPGISEFLSAGGTQDVLKFKVKADSAPVGLGRMVVNIASNGLDDSTTNGVTDGYENVKILRNGSLLTAGTDVTLYWDDGSESCTAHNNHHNCTAGTATTADLIISFPVTETLASGQSNTYLVQMDLNGVDTVGDSISAKFDRGDEDTAVSGGAVAGKTASTKYVFVTAAGNGLFDTTATNFGQESSTLATRNFIWSDKSDNNSAHPSVAGATGTVTTATGSADWTNGFKVNLPTTQVARTK